MSLFPLKTSAEHDLPLREEIEFAGAEPPRSTEIIRFRIALAPGLASKLSTRFACIFGPAPPRQYRCTVVLTG